MGPTDLPQFAVAAIHSHWCTGSFDLSPWVGDGWIAGLYRGGGRFVWGRFRDVDVAARTCSFYPDQVVELAALCPGNSYAYIDGYWGERAELVPGRKAALAESAVRAQRHGTFPGWGPRLDGHPRVAGCTAGRRGRTWRLGSRALRDLLADDLAWR